MVTSVPVPFRKVLLQTRFAKSSVSPSLKFALGLSALMALLLASVPVMGSSSKVLFLLTLLPLVLFNACVNTERAILLYVAWCWMDGVIRGVMGGGPVAILARDIVLTIVVVCWAGRRLRTRSFDPIRLPPGGLLIALFVVECLLQIANPYSLGLLSSLAGLKVHLSTIPLLFIGYDTFRRRDQAYALVVFLSLATLIIGGVSFLQYVEGREWTWAHFPGSSDAILQNAHVTTLGNHVATSGLFRPPGTTGAGGFTGVFVGYIFPLTFSLALISRKLTLRAPVKLLVSGILFAFIVFIFINSVRVALFDALFGVVLCATLIGGRLRYRAFVVLGAAVLIGAAAWTYTAGISGGGVADRFASTFSDPVSTLHGDRKTMFEEFSDVATRAPFGVGLGRVGAAAGHLGTAGDDSLGFTVFSESYVDTMVFETGLIGAFLITFVAIYFAVVGFRVLQRLKTNDDRCIAASLLASYCVLVCCFPFLPVLMGPPGSILFWLYPSVLLGVYGTPPKPKPLPARKVPAYE